MGKWFDMYAEYARQQWQQHQNAAKAKRFYYNEFGQPTSFEVIDGYMDEHVPYHRQSRAYTGFDPASPEGDKSFNIPFPNGGSYTESWFNEASTMPNVYFDPVTGKQFTCDINLDKFKKSNSVWTTLSNPVYQKYKKFLRIFDVQDAVIL